MEMTSFFGNDAGNFGTVDPKLLRTFLAVRRHGSFTEAAREAFLTQPAVSRRIRQLEAELGIRLFEQIGKSLHLTDAGRVLAAEAEKLLGSIERSAEAVRAVRSVEHGSLRIGASSTPGFYLLPRIVGRFHRRFPGVDLGYVVDNSLRIEERIVRNELDLGFVGAHLTHEDLRLEPVARDEVVCFAHPSHPLARRARIAAGQIEGQMWVTRERGSATRSLVEEWLAREGIHMSKTIELGCPEAVKALVAAGVGMSAISIHGLREEPRARLARLRIARMRLLRPIFLARHADKHVSPVMEAFLRDALPALATVAPDR
jgi:DNA-binding transcriptional LysR family regulator